LKGCDKFFIVLGFLRGDCTHGRYAMGERLRGSDYD
jgi:hypothetical protein